MRIEKLFKLIMPHAVFVILVLRVSAVRIPAGGQRCLDIELIIAHQKHFSPHLQTIMYQLVKHFSLDTFFFIIPNSIRQS